MITELEAISRAAWPARESVPYDGWLLAASGGVTRRNNSVHPISAGRLGLDEKIAHCESFYRERGQRAVFKLTDASAPGDLDPELADRGYRRSVATSVMVVSLEDVRPNDLLDPDVWLAPTLDRAWLSDRVTVWGFEAGDAKELRSTFERISAADEPCAFVSLEQQGRTAAQGLGVLRETTAILGEIATVTDWRRRGFARRVVTSLLAWAKEHGALRAGLQVVADNAPARALYEKLGFREVYTYWYRDAGPA